MSVDCLSNNNGLLISNKCNFIVTQVLYITNSFKKIFIIVPVQYQTSKILNPQLSHETDLFVLAAQEEGTFNQINVSAHSIHLVLSQRIDRAQLEDIQ